MKLILGIGNPEKKYDRTRHNIGIFTLEKIAESLGFGKLKLDKKLEAKIVKSDNLILAESQNFMNESGRTAEKISSFFKIPASDILIIHDDSDLNIKIFKMHFGKNSAGHHGIDSIISHLKTKDFWRLRIGIRPINEGARQKAEEFVLKKITKKELSDFNEIIPEITEVIKNWVNP